jgi:hypothetical protein
MNYIIYIIYHTYLSPNHKKIITIIISFQLHFIICKNYAYDVQFGIAHYAFTPHLSSL